MKRMMCILILWGWSILILSAVEHIEIISLPPIEGMERADLYVWKEIMRPKAVLVLCPGQNGNGEGLIRNAVWQAFAKKHDLGLVGLSFASNDESFQNDRSYDHVTLGSGKLLLEALRKLYGQNLPLLLYGFSAGAHFTSRLEEWKPDRIIAWCAYAGGVWENPQRTADSPPGIVACGDEDPRYGASLIYFKQGRALGKPWLWISVPKTGHAPNQKTEEFVRSYFHVILKNSFRSGLWVDIDRENEVTKKDAQNVPSVTAWLPENSLLDGWKAVHEP